MIIIALQEALDYDPAKRLNSPPPDLWINDELYLSDVGELVAELKRLNALLIASSPTKRRAAKQSILSSKKYFDEFLSSYLKTMGNCAAALTTGAIVAWLYHAGYAKDVLDGIWGHLKLPK